MAKYRCNNCGENFYVNLDHKPAYGEKFSCPRCGSDWVDYTGPGIQEREEPAPGIQEREEPAPKE